MEELLPFYGTIDDYLMSFRFPLNLDYLDDDDEDKKEHNEAENEVEDDNVENEEEKQK